MSSFLLSLQEPSPLTSTWPHLRCDVGLEEGDIKLYYTIPLAGKARSKQSLRLKIFSTGVGSKRSVVDVVAGLAVSRHNAG